MDALQIQENYSDLMNYIVCSIDNRECMIHRYYTSTNVCIYAVYVVCLIFILSRGHKFYVVIIFTKSLK